MKPYKILRFLTESAWLTIFWQSVDAILEKFLWLKQLFDTKILIQILSSYSVSKITALQHVKSG